MYLMYFLYGVHRKKVHANTRFSLDAGVLITRSGQPGKEDFTFNRDRVELDSGLL